MGGRVVLAKPSSPPLHGPVTAPLDVVELTLVLEEQTGVKLEDEELEDVRTVGDAIGKVTAKREAA